MELKVTIAGISPLIMNRYLDETGLATEDSTKLSIKPKSGAPRDVAEPKAYKLSDGTLFIPGPNILASMISAGKFHKVGKRQITTGKTTLVTAGIQITTIECSLGTKKFEVDSRRVVNPATGGARLCHRPRLDEWGTWFVLDVDIAMFSPDFVRQLVDDAGKKIGLCDYRPERKGPFGRFVVTHWVPVK